MSRGRTKRWNKLNDALARTGGVPNPPPAAPTGNHKLKQARTAMWVADPRCEVCRVVTFLPEDAGLELSKVVPGYMAPTRHQNRVAASALRRYGLLDRMATVDHFFPKRHPMRQASTPGLRRWRLLCHSCNRRRGSTDFHAFAASAKTA